MKTFKRYVILCVLIFALILLKDDFNGKRLEIRNEGNDSCEDFLIWNPVIAGQINKRPIDAIIDGEKYSTKERIYMSDNMQLMIPVNSIGEMFDCMVKVYPDDKVVIKKSMKKMELCLDSNKVDIDNNSFEFEESLVAKNDSLYIPINVLEDSLSIKYDWNVEKNEVSISSKKNTLPLSYDLRDEDKIEEIKDQGDFGTCWAFASLSAIESTLLPKVNLKLSPDHMSRKNSFNIDINIGGGYTMSMAYLVNWQGPVLEEDDPYGDGLSPDGLSPVKHVQEIQIIKDKALDEIKEAVFKYGGVQSSIYSTLNNIYSRSDYYNSKTSSYCYIGTKKPNHEIVIIGWDDEYPKENFNVKLEGDGAFICQNSWGKLFGDDGVFYVSYYDSNIGMQNLVYTSIEDTDNYDEIYQTDLCGWIGQIGYGSDTSYAANVYEARDDEIIEAVGLYATGIDTEYEIYIVEDFKDKKSLEMTSENMVASGTIRNKGYYTIPVDGVEVNQGNKFAIICKLTVPNSVHPIAIEYKAGELTDNVDLSDGEGYISHRGRDWVRTEEVQKCNVCLKAYTKRIDK